MSRIACIGDNCTDYYDETGEAHFGGNPLNVAVYLRRLGCEASYLGAVGTDEFGRQMKSAAEGFGVDLSHLQVVEGSTAVTHVIIRDGERILGDYDEGVMADFTLREEDYTFIRRHEFAVSGLWGHCENALARIREGGTRVAFDCADRPDDPAAVTAAAHTDLLFFSDDVREEKELEEKMAELYNRMRQGQAPEQASRMGEDSPRLVIATRGEKGSVVFDGKTYEYFGIVPCKVVDTMGAGDSYIAGFISAFAEGANIAECMRRGAESSAVTLGYAGAW